MATSGLLAACAETEGNQPPTAAPFFTPTPRPTARVTIAEALDGARYTLHLDDALIGIEEFAVQDTEAGLIVYSELRLHQGFELLQRRTLLLSSADTPLRYELEERAGGARSLWIAERTGDELAVLNDDLNAPLPALVEGLTAPALLLEGRPSALPYALLAWRQTGAAEAELALSCLDVTAPLPETRALTAGAGGAGTGEVIGATGYHASAPGALNPEFDFWVRDRARNLVRAVVPNYSIGLSAQMVLPSLPSGETLVIQRVAELPELAPVALPLGETLTITAAQGLTRDAILRLPSGAGPHPVVVLLGPEGLRPPWQGGEALLAAGWATVAWLPADSAPGQARPARAESRGEFTSQAESVAALAQALTARPDLDGERLAVIGWREGGVVAAQALAVPNAPWAAAVLLDPPAAGPLFPQAVEGRIERVLTPAFNWTPEQADQYSALTLDVGRDWLFEGVDEFTALGRRLDVSYLGVYAETSLSDLLAQSSQPVLLLADEAEAWSTDEVVTTLAAVRLGVDALPTTATLFAPQSEDLNTEVAAFMVDWLMINTP